MSRFHARIKVAVCLQNISSIADKKNVDYLFKSNMNVTLIDAIQIISPNINCCGTIERINSIAIVGGLCLSPTLLQERLDSSFAKIRRDHRLSIARHKSSGFIARRELSSSPTAAASYEAEDHVEDPRVRNANCNYGRACAHDILHPRSLSLSAPRSFRSASFAFSLSLTLSLSFSFFHRLHQHEKVTAARMNAHL